MYIPAIASGLGADFGGCAASQIQQYYELLGKYDQFVAGGKICGAVAVPATLPGGPKSIQSKISIPSDGCATKTNATRAIAFSSELLR